MNPMMRFKSNYQMIEGTRELITSELHVGLIDIFRTLQSARRSLWSAVIYHSFLVSVQAGIDSNKHSVNQPFLYLVSQNQAAINRSVPMSICPLVRRSPKCKIRLLHEVQR